MNRAYVHSGQLQCRVSVLGFNHCVSARRKVFASQLSYALLIFYKEDRFRAALRHLHVALALSPRRHRCLCDPWQIDLETRAPARLAVHPNVSAALLHHAVHSCKAKTRSLAFLFCREKWFEDV